MKTVKVLFLLALTPGFLVLSCQSTPTDVGKIDLFFDMGENPPVLGTDYEQFEGQWAVKNGVFEFNSYPPADGVSMESKIHFLNTEMVNGTLELDLMGIDGFTNAQGELDKQGNVGFLFRARDFKLGADNVRGYYVGVGQNEAKEWIVEAAYYGPGWIPIWQGNRIEGTPPFHLTVTMVDEYVTAVVTNGSKEVYNDTFQTSRYGSLTFGDVGLRTWIANGNVGNIKITNIGSGLDHEN